MKAVTRSRYGGPDLISISKLPAPTIQNDDILVRVEYTTVNRTDCAHLTGEPKINRLVTGIVKPTKLILGTDFSGEIVETGKAVRNFTSGDRIFGFKDTGFASMAEYLVCKATDPILQIPENVDFSIAAASLEGSHYALNFLNKVRLKPGQTALVNGGSGAIGSALLQFLKNYQVETVTTGPASQVENLKNLGASEVIDYKPADFSQISEKFDFVFDAVGKSRFKTCKNLLKKNGIYMSSETGPGMENLWLSFRSIFAQGQKVRFPFPKDINGSLRIMAELLKKEQFSPLLDRSFPSDDAEQAFQYVASGQKNGNVLLQISADRFRS
ncbi:NAD(P)-dependent alcohol dehydrogenase [Christiangramia flava]|uniref:Uncharacterized protein n=1 Tax=Christiangramia flava JLT2011 TaxID=1229726 RepID=A0A1L7I489_9FLAO|nr:NAD(P)-dependent alcohol dehydrogenase [Christiangramia flava]APU68401.1 hypothetical protein GRFL_1677 [Christiangramia flava JLT2011]OSS40811.1 alcohol dehydrogenase, zinc-containing [Christiangramia flava JLT2011]